MEGALFNPGFLGSHFLWWVGQIAPSENWRGNQQECRFEEPSDIPGWGFRYKVRIIGLHDKDEDENGDSTTIPNDQLPWAQVMYPVTAGGGQGGSFTTPNLRQGNFVFGFFLDGQDQQVPVIMGVLGNNAKTEIPDLDSHIFAPMSGYANHSDDPSNVVAREVVDPNSTASTETSGDATNRETSATDAQEEVLIEEIPLACPDPATNSEMQNIQTCIQQMTTDIGKAQAALSDFTSAASLPLLELDKTVDEILESRAGEVTQYMGSLMGRVQQYTTGQFGDQMRQMLALAPTSAGLDLRKFQLNGLSGLAGTFAGITDKLPGLVLGALKNAFKKKKNRSPSASPTQPQIVGEAPPLPEEGYYIPSPMCATEEVVGQIIGSTLNEIMTGFDDAIAPAVTAAAGESGEAGAKAGGSSPFGAISGALDKASDIAGVVSGVGGLLSGGGIGGLLGGGGLSSLLPGGFGNLLPGGLGALKGLPFDINTALGFVGDISSIFASAPKPQCSPNTAFTMARGGNGALELPSLQSITESATNLLQDQLPVDIQGLAAGDLTSLTGALPGNIQDIAAGALPGNLQDLAAGALPGGLNLTSITDSFGGDLNFASVIPDNFEIPSLENAAEIFGSGGQNLGGLSIADTFRISASSDTDVVLEEDIGPTVEDDKRRQTIADLRHNRDVEDARRREEERQNERVDTSGYQTVYSDGRVVGRKKVDFSAVLEGRDPNVGFEEVQSSTDQSLSNPSGTDNITLKYDQNPDPRLEEIAVLRRQLIKLNSKQNDAAGIDNAEVNRLEKEIQATEARLRELGD